jgi:Uma2 family endonuclease
MTKIVGILVNSAIRTSKRRSDLVAWKHDEPGASAANCFTAGEPAWRVALLFPPQGSWSETDYLELDTSRLVEFSAGCIEVHDMPTKAHQRIVRFLFQVLQAFVTSRSLGEVFFAPLPIRLQNDKFREPDIIFVARGRGEYRGYPDGADLVIEVTSDDAASRRRDLEIKREEYSRAGIPEYWIVDPQQGTVTVLHLDGETYQEIGVFRPGQSASSHALREFSVPVDQVFREAEEKA